MNQRSCRITRLREQPENSKIDRVMFLDILNRWTASGVHTVYSHREVATRITELDNLFSQGTDAEGPAARFDPPCSRSHAARREG
jgi:hypothetical protein